LNASLRFADSNKKTKFYSNPKAEVIAFFSSSSLTDSTDMQLLAVIFNLVFVGSILLFDNCVSSGL